MHRAALRRHDWLYEHWCRACMTSSSSSATIASATWPRRLCSSHTTAGGSNGADGGTSSVKVLSPFRSFDNSLTEVRAENVPSAKAVSHMLPSARKLSEDLPSAAELEAKYMQGRISDTTNAAEQGSSEEGDASAAGTMATATGDTTSVQTAEMLLDDEDDMQKVKAARFGRTRGPITRQHWLLAYRALFWGTVYATLGFLVTVVIAMYLCGYHTLSDLRDGMRAKVRRDEVRLQLRAAEEAGQSVEDIRHMVIDLGSGLAAWQQVMEVWQTVQELAEKEAQGADESQNVS